MTTLEKKAYTGLGQFVVALWVLLFLPAWSLQFWQAWIYWTIFSVIIFIITVYFLKHDPKLIERRLQAGPVAEKEKSQKIIQLITSILFIGVILFPGFDYRFHWSSVMPIVSLVADIFVAIGLSIIFLVFKENSFTSSIIETDKNQKVIDTGPYAIVRHPMYAGALVLFIATPFALGSFWSLILGILICVMMGIRLLDEEKFLVKYLKGYTEYCRKTRYHLIPYIW